MITFASFPVSTDNGGVGAHSEQRRRAQYAHGDDDELMDLDEDERSGGGSRLTYPGEPITSSQAFMR